MTRPSEAEALLAWMQRNESTRRWRPTWSGHSCGPDLAFGDDQRWGRQLIDDFVLERLGRARIEGTSDLEHTLPMF